MRVLLTGESGFVGGYFRQVIPCIPFVDKKGLPVDLRDSIAVGKSIREIKPNIVVHLAGQSSVPNSFINPMLTYYVNFIGTLNLLGALKESGFKGCMLYVGSGEVYGLVDPVRMPIIEECPLKPRNPYAVSKLAAESLCYQWSQTESFKIVLVRPFNHIGPGQSERFVVSDFTKQVVEIKRGMRLPKIFVGDIDVTRDFTDVRDVVRAYTLLLEYGVNGEVYNVCSGKEQSVRSILEMLIELSGVTADVVQDQSKLRKSEQRRMVASYDKLHRTTGWRPALSLEQTLKDVLTRWEMLI